MDTNEPTGASGEQPTAAPVVTPDAGEQPQPGNLSEALQSMDESQLLAVLEASESGAPSEIPADTDEPEPTPKAETPEEEGDPNANPNDPEGEQPPEGEGGEPGDGKEGSAPAKPLNRLSVRFLPVDEQQQMAQALDLVRKGEAATVAEAFQQLAGAPAAEQPGDQPEGAEPPAAEATPAAKPAPKEAPEVAEIQTRLTDLRAQRKQAKADYDLDAEAELTDQIEDTLVELQAARIRAEAQQEQASTFRQQFTAAVDEMEAKHPEALDEDSAFYRLLDDKVTAAQARNDPALADPRYIIAFADEVAGILGKTQKARSAPPAPPARTTRPAGSAVAPGHSQAPRPTTDQVKQLISNATPEDIAAAVFDH